MEKTTIIGIEFKYKRRTVWFELFCFVLFFYLLRLKIASGQKSDKLPTTIQ